MQIIPLPAFRDNYIWLLRAGACAVVVDPGEAAPVLRYLADEGLTLAAILITHHHPDHVGYYGESALFCGDTLFAAGCGRLFEGTPAQMFDSLQKLAALPGDTRVYCTHEYTLSNLAFAVAVEPVNDAISERIAASEAMRAANQPTVPFPLSGEMLTNPFLRTHEPAVIRQAETQAGRGLTSPVEVFAALREWKNRF